MMGKAADAGAPLRHLDTVTARAPVQVKLRLQNNPPELLLVFCLQHLRPPSAARVHPLTVTEYRRIQGEAGWTVGNRHRVGASLQPDRPL
jgi:hypothetical protein